MGRKKLTEKYSPEELKKHLKNQKKIISYNFYHNNKEKLNKKNKERYYKNQEYYSKLSLKGWYRRAGRISEFFENYPNFKKNDKDIILLNKIIINNDYDIK